MDEKDQKSLTIGDILDQLVKPTILKSPAGQVYQSQEKKAVPSQQIVPKLDTEVKLPSLGGSGKKDMPSTAQLKDESGEDRAPKLFIRTMAEDIERLKKGEVPLGVEMSTPPAKLPPVSNTSPVKPLTPPAPSRPAEPIETAEHSLTPPPIPAFTAPRIPDSKPSDVRPFSPPRPPTNFGLPSIRPDNTRIKEEIHIPDDDEELLPPFPGAPIPKKQFKKPEDEKLDYGIIAKVISSGMTTGILSTVVIAVLAYFALSLFVFNGDNGEVITPTPTPGEEQEQQAVNELDAIFKNVPEERFALSDDVSQVIPQLAEFIKKQVIKKKEFKRLILSSQDQTSLGFTGILNKLSISYPLDIGAIIEGNNMTLLYGQEEVFGPATPGSASDKRIVFIAEVKDEAGAKSIMNSWEFSMPRDFKNIFEIEPSKEASPGFLDNDRRGVQIRYKNFPLPDKSLDYAIVRSLSGRYYLIIANSREAMFSPADKIRGL